MSQDRAFDALLARLLAAALVAELRAEDAALNDAVHGERPAAGKSDAGAKPMREDTHIDQEQRITGTACTTSPR